MIGHGLRNLLLVLLFVGCVAERPAATAPGVARTSLAVPGQVSWYEVETLDGGPPGAGVSQSASGHGTLTIEGSRRTFSFTAVRHGDGEVSGEFELKNHDTGARMHGDVTCFFAFPRPEDPERGAAFLGGVVTHSDAGFPAGTPVIFNAFDNGEGRNALFPDFLSLMGATTPEVVARQCALGLRITPVLPIEGGNIQVRP